MPLFNAVLLPAVDFRDRIVAYAQDHHSKVADGYCLSHKVYPHITLCQFEAEESPMIFIDGLFNPIFLDTNVADGSGIHEGYSWVEWTVKKDEWLVELQDTVRGALESEGATVTAAKSDDYHPHMSFCRVPKDQADKVELPIIEQSNKPWIFTIGSSDKNGQFLG